MTGLRLLHADVACQTCLKCTAVRPHRAHTQTLARLGALLRTCLIDPALSADVVLPIMKKISNVYFIAAISIIGGG